MSTYRVHKVTAVPATFAANDVFFVGPASSPDFMEIYVANSAGDQLRRLITANDVALQISTAIDALDSTVVVADIDERDALAISGEVIVVDASADPTVDSGGAKYYANTAKDAWIKLSETESMDVVLAWASITGGPSSSPALIDAAVVAAHTHANKSELDKIAQDAEGNILYDGELPASGWSTEAW